MEAVSSLEKRVKELIKRHTETKLKSNELENKIRELSKTIEVQKETIKNLEEKNKIIKLAKSLTESNGNNTPEMKYKINEIVREIDKCIAQLNS